jgi:hypothetical protein
VPVELLIWLAVLIVLVMAGGIGLMIYRRRVLAGRTKIETDRSLLDELRSALRRGEMTEDEYKVARAAVVDRLAGRTRTRTDSDQPTLIAHPDGSVSHIAPNGRDLTGQPLPQPSDPDDVSTDNER